ncbi:MAG TPA: DUF5336 domain-containing protein [Mycobacterium sp.]|nr:DUF5336 domain-containing protein [Mycobacterium sp.]
MTYPPGSPGYQPQPQGSYGAANPSFVRSADTVSKLPLYLQVAVVVLGLVAYLANFGPTLPVNDSALAGITGDVGLAVPAAVLAALLAAVGLLPKAKNYAAVVAVLAVLGALLAISTTLNKDDIYFIGWALWVVLGAAIVQAIVAVGALLLDAGVVTAPAPRPKYDPYAQYGLPPGSGYYGQPSGPHAFGHQQGPQQSGYPSYGGYPSGPSTGGFSTPSGPSTGGFSTGSQHTQQQGPPTPPTGFPSFSPPPAGGSATGGQEQGSANSSQSQQSQGGQGSQTSSSSPSGPTQP